MDNNNKITVEATISVPVSSLGNDYKELLGLLTMDNPEYKNARFFSKGFVSDKIPKKLFFFRTNELSKTILLPRNIDNKYLKSVVEYNKLSNGREISVGFISNSFKLRNNQELYLNGKVLPYIKSINNNINNIDILLNCPCGSGKTIISLYLSSIYSRTTIVCVTTKKIGIQFINSIKLLFPKWTCGWAEDKKEYDITIGTYSLLSGDYYSAEYFKRFGHIILDEFHRCGAITYSKILEKASCRYRTSLTATFRRKDGLHKILRYHAGKVIEMDNDTQKATIYPILTQSSVNEELFRVASRTSIKPIKLSCYSEVAVKEIKTKKEVDRGIVTSIDKVNDSYTIKSYITNTQVEYLFSQNLSYILGTVSAPMLDTEISEHQERTDIIVGIIVECLKKGRRIIVLSKRKEQLYYLSRLLTRRGIDSGVFVSDKDPIYKKYCSDKGRTIAENAAYTFNETRVILGIDKLAEEGMDAPKFDTLIYAHPIKDIEQSLGRVIRDNPEGNIPAKKSPIAFYLIDNIGMYKKSFYGEKVGAKQMFLSLGNKVEKEISFIDLKNKGF